MGSHFFQRSQALHDFHETGSTQVYHAFLIGHVHDINFCTVVHNDFLHFIADRHDFINTDAAFKAFAAAAVAANRAVELPILSQVRIGKAGFFNAGTGGRSTSRLQFWTQSAQQPLRHNQADRAGEC